jgi:hypothetical protein
MLTHVIAERCAILSVLVGSPKASYAWVPTGSKLTNRPVGLLGPTGTTAFLAHRSLDLFVSLNDSGLSRLGIISKTVG